MAWPMPYDKPVVHSDPESSVQSLCPAVLLVSFLACCVLHASTGAGQTVGTMTGAINGSVADSTHAVLPGVTIVISSAALMGTRTTRTNAEGLYRFPALAPGEYTLVYTLDGFEAVRREGIYVGLGRTATVNVELEIATLREKVIVERNSPVIDQQSTAIAATFDAHQLANLPSARSMWAIQAATPAVYIPRFDLGASATGLGGPVSAYGTSGFNRPMVEGISVTGINPTGFTLDHGAFEEVSVGTAAHGPEWPCARRAHAVHQQGGRKSVPRRALHRLPATKTGNRSTSTKNRSAVGRRVDSRCQHARPTASGLTATSMPTLADSSNRTRLWWYSSVRHQEVSARQVNFPVKPLRTSLTNYSGKVTYQVAPRPQARRVRADGSEPSAEPPGSLRPYRLRRRPDDGDQRVGGGDHRAARLGLGLEGGVELRHQ